MPRAKNPELSTYKKMLRDHRSGKEPLKPAQLLKVLAKIEELKNAEAVATPPTTQPSGPVVKQKNGAAYPEHVQAALKGMGTAPVGRLLEDIVREANNKKEFLEALNSGVALVAPVTPADEQSTTETPSLILADDVVVSETPESPFIF